MAWLIEGLVSLCLVVGAAFAFVDQNIFRGRLPMTLSDPKPDHATLRAAKNSCKS